MNLKIFIDKEHEEEVLVYAHEKTKLIDSIERLINNEADHLIGYKENEIIRLDINTVYCFVVEDNKIYALTDKEKLQLKCRLYHLEERLPDTFVKINQSCIANIEKINCFDASFSGSLTVNFKNGYSDYVSRRKVKNVKERLGIK